MSRLLVNIDHVATLRNVRGEGYPDPVEAAETCEKAGAAGIVFHLRGDRRHIRDDDVYRLKTSVRGLLDFEMAATDEMIRICREISPDLVTLVPENREELTTEGGLAMESLYEDFRDRIVPALQENGTDISLFLDPVPKHIEIAAELNIPVIELHTGRYANASGSVEKRLELKRLEKAADLIHSAGMHVNAGHGLNRKNLPDLVKRLPQLKDVSIGHALISDSLFMGLEKAVLSYISILEGRENDSSGFH